MGLESDTWSCGLSSTSTTRSCQSPPKQNSEIDYYVDKEVEIEKDDHDDDVKFPCPICAVDFNLFQMCWHLEVDHAQHKSGVCPVCFEWVGQDLVGYSQPRKVEVPEDSNSDFSSPRKESEEDDHSQPLPSGSMSSVSNSKMAPDPLWSFLRAMPDESTNSTLKAPTRASLKERVAGGKKMEKDVNIKPLSDKDQQEKLRRCDFVRGLLLSTFLDEL
ncbi:hypothetical protein ACFE04_016425 [Oxalis oulophora]